MKKILFILCFCVFSTQLFSQEKKEHPLYCVAFYNLENLFDTISGPNDKEYTPTGSKEWNTEKYYSKLKKMSYCISKIGKQFSPMGPSILGVAEVENKSVLEDLVKQEAIKNVNYKIVHLP